MREKRKVKSQKRNLNTQATFDLKGEAMKSDALHGSHFRCQINGFPPFIVAPFIALSGAAPRCGTGHGAVHPSAGDVLIPPLSAEPQRGDSGHCSKAV
jgi:hypothetical protein